MDHEPAAGATVAPAIPTHKTCTKCGETKPMVEYSPQKLGKHGRTAQCKACFRAYNKANAERKKARDKEWRDRNAVTWRGYTNRWRAENPDIANAQNAKRRARIIKACPPWVDLAAIRAVYAEAQRLTKETGIPHEVDHIVPLAGRYACGLHVPWNLQVITATDNRRKSNKLIRQ